MTDLCVRVVDPVLRPDAPMWGDASGAPGTPALEWVGTLAAAGVPFRAGPDAGCDDGRGLLLLPTPDAVDVPAAAGRPVLTGPPPDGAAARLQALAEVLGALVVPDLRGVLVLRLDDPGAAVKRLLAGWAHEDVSPAAWAALWAALDGFGRLSVFCCPGWVTADGRVVDSRAASPAEWAALDEGARRGLVDLECHGFTHMDPDVGAWRRAPDRHEAAHWYRELWPPRLAEEPPVPRQLDRLRAWQRAAGPGSALVAPGEAWGLNTVAAARRAGFALFTSWEVCRLRLPVPAWTVGVGSPYLDEPDAAWLADGLPAVGYWHDRDMAVGGPRWAPDLLRRWRDSGATRAWAFADLARAYAVEVDAALDGDEVVVRRAPAAPLRTIRR